MRINKIILILVSLVILAILMLVFLSQNKQPVIPIHTNNFSNDTTKDYNNFHYLIPGKSTISDIEKLNGAPLRITKSGNEEHLYYQAPFSNVNPVLAKNNVLVYASEYVFGNYRGSFSDFINAYGNADKVFYDGYGFAWLVYYKHGIAIQYSSNDIARVIYFVPNNISLFNNTVVKDFNLSDTPVGLQ